MNLRLSSLSYIADHFVGASKVIVLHGDESDNPILLFLG